MDDNVMRQLQLANEGYRDENEEQRQEIERLQGEIESLTEEYGK